VPIVIWIMIGYFETTPLELEEAALIDGATRWQVFWHVALPIARPGLAVAFILAGEMAVAYFQVHFPQSPFPSINQGTPAVLFCFLFLYFAFVGAGAWSIDSLIARPMHPRPHEDVDPNRSRLVYRW